MQKIFTSTVVRIACVLTIFMFGISGNVNAQLSAGALNFDGTDDYVNVPNVSIMNQSPLTIEAWVKPDVRTDGTNINQYGNNVISNDLTGSYGTGFGVVVLSNNSSGIIVAYKNGLRFINTSLTAGTWYHVSVVYTPGMVKTYLNGNLIDTHNFSQNTGTSSTLIRIGKFSDDNTLGTTRFFKGDIDEVRIWNRALCQGEIINNMSCEVTLPQTGLYSYYKFNVGLIGLLNSLFATLPDVSGNNNDGTLNNFSLLGVLSNWVAGKANGSCAGFTPPLATITATGNTTLCQGDAVLLTANSGNSYQWYNFGVAIGGETNQTYSASQTGEYTVAVTTGNCTITSAIKTVTVNPVPSLFINSTTTSICAGTPVSLSLGGSNNAANAANFNAVNANDYVSIPHQAQLNPATITLEAWVRPSQAGVDKGIIMKLPASGSGQIGYGFRQTSANRFQFVIGSIGNEVFAQSAAQSIGPWYHLTGTYDGSVIRLYVNGSLAGSAAASGAITSTAPIIVGNSNSLNQPFKGAIDELRISNTVKTSTQISCDYKVSTDPTSSNLVGYWRMNEINGTTTPDVTTYHNNGLIVNTASLISSSASVGNNYRWDAATGITNVNNACITLSPTATTTYKATATNSYGCAVKDSVTITVFPSGQTFNVTGGGNYCIGAPGLPIGLSGSQVGISYQLKKGASNIGGLVQGTGNAITVGLATESGTYTIIAVNNNCTNTMSGTASVIANSSPVITLTSITNPVCNGANTGAIDLNVSGGTNPRIYTWSNNATTEDLSNIGAGVYKLNVSDVNGCKDSATYTLTEPTAPIMSAVVTNVSCNGTGDGSITLTTGGTAPYTYSWSNMATSKNISNLTPDNYSVSVMDAHGCISDKTYTVSQPAALAPIATPINISCGGNQDGAVNLVVNGGTAPYIYNWSTNATTQNISNLNAGSYSVTVTDAHGCEAGASTTVTQGAPLQVSGLATDVTCFGAGNGSIQLTPVTGIAPFTYSWSNNSTAQNISNLTPGTYSVTVHDSRNCTTTGSYTINQSSSALVQSVTHNNAMCNGSATGSIDLTVSGGTAPYSYLWNNNATSQDITGVAAGTYIVAITDAKNCIVNTGATVTEPAAIQLSAATTKTYCGDSTASIHLNVTGGTAPYTFHWNTGSTNQNMNGLHTGDYSVTVTDANGCSANELYTISDSSSMSMTASVTNAMCHSQSSGAIALTITGGIAPFSYAWSDNVNTEDRSQIPAGNYSVVVTDHGGCKVQGTYTIEEPGAMSVSAEKFDVSCNVLSNGGGTADGAIYLTIDGGAAPYSFEWYDTAYYANTQDIEWIAPGNYHVNITDDNGCVTSDTFVVNQPTLIHIAATVTNIGCNTTLGAVSTVVTGGLPPYSYEWSTSATTSAISDLTPGFYNLIVTDDYGCSVNDFYNIDADSFALSSTVTNVACNGTSTGAVDVTVESGSAPFTYAWSNNATSQDLNNISAGSYTLFATDANGCSDTLTAIVAQPAAMVATTTVTNNMCSGQNSGAINLTVSGGTAPYTYVWNNNATTEDISGLSAGTYNVVIKDANGCIQTASATITSPMAIVASAIATNATCSANNGTITLTVNGGVPPYTYDWGNGVATQNRTGLAGGTYTVTITDANGCTKTATATVNQTIANIVATATATNITCNGANNGSINLTVSGGATPYNYSWTGGASTQNISNKTAGTYNVTVTDANGCTATASATITEPSAITASATATNATCGANNGTITLNVTGGTSPYTYNWGAGVTTQNRTGLAGGTYNVTITDANGCTKIATATVGQTTTPSITATVNNPSCGNNNGSVNITVTGGTTPYSYLWNNNATSQNLSNVSTGTYSVVVTDANHCTATGSYTLTSVDTSAPVIAGPTSGTTITQNPAAPALDFNVFVMNNATLSGGQTEGGFALGGNLTLAGDHTVSTNSAGTFTVGSVPVTLVVGGKVIYQSGNSLYVNQNGYVKIGDSTLSKVWYKDQNNAYSPIRITNGNNYNGTPRINLQANAQNLNVSATNNPVFQSNVIDFASAFVQLKSNATSLSTLADNAALTNANGNPIAHTNLPSQVKINLATGTNVLNINASDLNAVQNFTYNQQPASNRILVINVNAPGTFSWNVWNSGGIGSSNSPYIIYNFYNTNTLTVQGNGSVYGTLFAPYADINKTNSQNIAGQIIGQSLNQTGGANLYNKFAATVTSGTTTVIAQNSTNNRNTGTTACAYTVSGTEFNTTATDNCATPTLTYALTGATTGTGTNLAGVMLNKGTTTITWTATDGTNVSAYNFNVVVADNVNPTVVTKNIIIVLDANGNATIAPADVNNGSTDNCGIVTYGLSKTNFNTTNIGANTVTLTATDASGNTASGTATVTVVDNAAPVIACPASITVACNTTPAKTGIATATDNAGTPVVTYTDVVTGNTTVRTWKATDASNNFSTCTQTITVSPMSAAAVATNVTCNGAANGTVNLTVNGGVAPYSYSWTGGTTTQNISGKSAGTYNVTVTDANGCTATTSAAVTEPSAIAATATATNTTCTANNGTITLNVTGGVAPYTYNWGAGVTTQNRTGLTAGTYNVTVTDANGCTRTAAATISQSTANITATTTVTNTTCNGANGAITLAVSGGTAPYTYNWGGITTQNRTGLIGGTYNVTITDANGCTKTATATVNQGTSTLAVTGTTTNITCNGNNNGAITLTVSGGATPYTYSWTGGATTKNISGKVAGVYTVVVTDYNGCSVTSSFTITQPAAIVLNAVQSNVSCNGNDDGSIDLTVSGGTAPYSYNWNLGGSNNNNNNNCWNWWCNNNCWNNNNTSSSSQDVNGLEEGNYSVTVTDANGCTATGSYTITEPSAISVSVSKTNVACKNGNNGTITLAVSGGTSPYTYNWGNNITTQNRNGLTAGIYNVTITDAHGCTNTASISLSQPSSSLTANASVTNITCKGNNNGAVNLSVSGGTSPYTYSWTGGATSQDISGRTAGVYTVVITDANGCSLSQSYTITEPATALSVNAALTHVSCNGGDNGAINLTVTGGAAPYTYNWNLGGSNNNNNNCWNWWNWWCNNNCYNNCNNNAHSKDVSGLEEGTYSVSVTDANGCMVSGVYTINEPTAITLTANKTNVGCKNGSNGTITLAVSGGTAPYTYNWGGGITTQNRNGLAAGTYSVIVTDAKGCTKSTSVTITQPTSGVTISGTVTNVTCNGSNNGAVNVTVSGGSSPYTYNWTGGATTQDISGKAAGNYTVTVQDANGCSDDNAFTITQPNAISASIAVSPVVTVTNGQSYTIYDGYGPQSVTLTASASGGNGGFTYHWSPSTGVSNVNSASPSVSPSTTTTYTVTITDSKGCSKTVSKTINVVDVTCGNKDDKVIVCHNGNEICVSSNAVQAHLNHGCYVGHCNGNSKGETADNDEKGIQELVGKNIRVYPNPSNGIFLLELPEGVMNANVLITDMSGRMIERRVAMGENSIRFDLSKVAQGIYMIQVSVGTDKYQSKITIE